MIVSIVLAFSTPTLSLRSNQNGSSSKPSTLPTARVREASRTHAAKRQSHVSCYWLTLGTLDASFLWDRDRPLLLDMFVFSHLFFLNRQYVQWTGREMFWGLRQLLPFQDLGQIWDYLHGELWGSIRQDDTAGWLEVCRAPSYATEAGRKCCHRKLKNKTIYGKQNEREDEDKLKVKRLFWSDGSFGSGDSD